MTYTNRILAPVASPPPPKPPQLNIVASSLMPDVETDTLAPGQGPMLASGGFDIDIDPASGRRIVNRLPGDTSYSERARKHNALVAAVGLMDDIEVKQVEQEVGVTPESLPVSVFPTTSAATRWEGGFAYDPENQYPGVIADPCGQPIDLPYLTPNDYGTPVTSLGATPSTTGGTIAAATGTLTYYVVPVMANGSQSAPATVTTSIASGTTGSVALAWTAPTITPVSYNVYGRVAGTLALIANVTTTSFTDTGKAGQTLTAYPGSDQNLVGYIPFLIQVEDWVTAYQWAMRDLTGRALRLLDNATPNAIEREFWTGAFAQNTYTGPIYQADNGLPGVNAFLMQGTSASAGGTGQQAVDLTPPGGSSPNYGAVSITRGIQILEDYIASMGFGGQGMIHVAPETSPTLLGARRVGSLLLSVMDNIFVPGSGYPTATTPGGSTPVASGPINNSYSSTNYSVPPAGTAWIYATDLVSVRLGEPQTFPTTLAEATDRGSNTIRVRAERFAAATFDINRFAAVRVTLST